jgi:hypothetical protein
MGVKLPSFKKSERSQKTKRVKYEARKEKLDRLCLK